MSINPDHRTASSGAELSNLSCNPQSGRYCAATYFPPTADMFRGHFPGDAIAPGYCLLELILDLLTASGCPLAFKTIHIAKFHQPVVPGDRLDVDIQLQPGTADVFAVDAVLRRSDQIVLELSGVLSATQ